MDPLPVVDAREDEGTRTGGYEPGQRTRPIIGRDSPTCGDTARGG